MVVVVRGEEEEGAGGKERSRGGAAGEKETGVERAVKSQERSQWLGGRTELGRGAARVSPPAFGPRLGRDLFSRRRRRPPIRFRRRSSDSPQPVLSSPQPVLSLLFDRPAPLCPLSQIQKCRTWPRPSAVHTRLSCSPALHSSRSFLFFALNKARAPRSHSRQWARRISRRVSVVVARNDVVWKLLC